MKVSRYVDVDQASPAAAPECTAGWDSPPASPAAFSGERPTPSNPCISCSQPSRSAKGLPTRRRNHSAKSEEVCMCAQYKYDR